MASKYIVLVPMDFSEVADTAVNHAAMVAKSFRGEVHLLHVVSSNNSIDEAKEKLEKICKNAESKYHCLFNYYIEKGSIFDEIGKVAERVGAMLIVMGTHGLKGMQYITGSHALKVIGHSKVPFIVVQNKKPKGNIKDIVLPIRFSQETKSKLSITASLAKHFNATIHIFTSKENDEFLQTRVSRELIFAKHYFDEREVKYDVEVAQGLGNFIPQMLDYANSIDADLLAIVNSSGDGGFLPEVFKGSGEQEIISNKYEIPTIIMNPSQHFVPEHFG